jgi:hypothetical protein
MLVRVAVVRAADGSARAEPALLRALQDTEGRGLQGDELAQAFPELPSFVDVGVAEAHRAAAANLEALKARAREALEDERDAVLVRLKLSLQHQGVAAGAIDQALAGELAFYDALDEALTDTHLTLDSACAFVVNR